MAKHQGLKRSIGIVIAVFLLLAGACTDRSGPAVTATTTRQGSPTATPSPSPSPTATPLPSPTPVRALPAGIANVISVVESGDIAAIRRLMLSSNVSCTLELGAGGPPRCEPGETPGTRVEVYRFIGCEPEWIRPAMMDALLQDVFRQPFRRYAVFPTYGLAPVAVFTAPSAPTVGAGVAARIVGLGVIAELQRTCGAGDTASRLIPAGQTDFLLFPPRP